MPQSAAVKKRKRRPQASPSCVFNAFELSIPSRTPWHVSLYQAESINVNGSHEDRGSLKSAVWDYRKENRSNCPGPDYFVLDLGADTVAIPTRWEIPIGTEFGGYRFTPIQDVNVSLDDSEHTPIVRGLIKEAFKRSMKSVMDDPNSLLGLLWQHWNDYCQIPSVDETESEFVFCRKFGFDAEVLQGNRWCARLRVSTQTIDGRSFARYGQMNDTKTLADWIQRKQNNRLTRKSKPSDVAILHMVRNNFDNCWMAKRHELAEPAEVINWCRKSGGSIPPNVPILKFERGEKIRVEVPACELRLVLDSQITQEEHRETIIDPDARFELWMKLREVLDESDAFGQTIQISSKPANSRSFHGGIIAPPAIRVREDNHESVIPVPDRINKESLALRGRERARHLKNHGLLQTGYLNPLLACPKRRFSESRTRRLMFDLNGILENQNLPFRFSRYVRYNDPHDINTDIVKNDFNCALVVLPEGRRSPHSGNSVHEKVKRLLTVPSQCIQFDNTFSDRSNKYRLPTGKGDLPNRVRQSYINCIWGLAIKNHCVPFAPAESFHYNVHIGIDVGGRDNNRAMVCVGYGFQSPRDRLVFVAEEIPVDGAKAEPIPVESLKQGVIKAIGTLADELNAVGQSIDISKTLFLRDGPMLGNIDQGWSEKHALEQILAEATQKGWVTSDPQWAAVEVSKTAEGWRPLTSYNGTIQNPLVGQWIAPFQDPNEVLLSTTGAPYLSQGTASPLLLRMFAVTGELHRAEVLRDVVWEADMCFTKPDMGMKLPWVVHVANEGALQLARSYEFTGVPV